MNYNPKFLISSKPITMIVILAIFLSHYTHAQEKEKKDYTPYELLSSYYNQDFRPFTKKCALLPVLPSSDRAGT